MASSRIFYYLFIIASGLLAFALAEGTSVPPNHLSNQTSQSLQRLRRADGLTEFYVDYSLLTDYLKVSSMSKQYIDVTNSSHPFFQDICFNYTSRTNTDVSLFQRQSYFIDASKYCDSCSFVKFDFSRRNALCDCSSSAYNSTPFSKDQEPNKTKTIDLFSFSNVDLFYCYQSVFSKAIFSKNMGTYIVLTLLVIEAINFVLFVVDAFGPLMRYFSRVHNKSSSKGNKETVIPFKNSIEMAKSNSQRPFQSNDEIDYQTNQHRLRNQPVSLTNEELNDLELTQAILHDKRTFLEHYWNVLLSFQPVLTTFFEVNNKKLKLLKVAIFFLAMTLIMGFNALFFNDSYIEKSSPKGMFNFLDQLPKVLICYLLTIIVINLMNFLAYDYRGIREIEKESSFKKVLPMVKEFMQWYSVKVYTYYFLQFAMLFLCWYYITAFCSVYRNNQVNWFVSSLISFVVYMIIPLMTSLFVGGLRYISITMRIRWLHPVIMLLYHYSF